MLVVPETSRAFSPVREGNMTRRLIKVVPEDAERMAQVFDLLLGDNLDGRKNHIAAFGYKYLDMADIS